MSKVNIYNDLQGRWRYASPLYWSLSHCSFMPPSLIPLSSLCPALLSLYFLSENSSSLIGSKITYKKITPKGQVLYL